MKQPVAKNDIIERLQQEILSMQGFKKSFSKACINTGLGPVETAFPQQTFPTGAIHEFLSYAAEDAAATNGFMVGLLGNLMQQGGVVLWISNKRTVFPPALKFFGIDAERIIFVDLKKQKDVLWAVEEALKCASLSAVVGELKELTFTESRRLQLAVEQSRVTGFLHRYAPATENTVACVSRWKITPLSSVTEDGLPGVGFPRWNVELVKVRNGKPGSWQFEWAAGAFRHIVNTPLAIPAIPKRKIA